MTVAGPYTELDAWIEAEQACREKASRQGLPYPMPPGNVVGIGPSDLYTNPAYGTHYLSAPRRHGTEDAYYLEVTPSMDNLEIAQGTKEIDRSEFDPNPSQRSVAASERVRNDKEQLR